MVQPIPIFLKPLLIKSSKPLSFMKRVLLFSFAMIILFSSCNYIGGERIKGDGQVSSETRTGITDFKGVDVSGAIELYLTQESVYSVKVETDKNLQQYIEVYKDGDILRVRPANNTNLDPTGKIKVYVSAPSYRKVGASGACKVVAQSRLSNDGTMDIDLSGASQADLDIKAPNVGVEASGACDIALKGETKNLSIDGSGSSNVKAFELLSENVDVEISGAGDVEVYASVKLDVRASGSSSIRYKGNASVDSNVSGAGSVKKAD